MNSIDELLALERKINEAQVVRTLGGIRVDSADDFVAVYNTWIHSRPRAYRKAKLRTSSRCLHYPCRVIFHAVIATTGTSLRIEAYAATSPL